MSNGKRSFPDSDSDEPSNVKPRKASPWPLSRIPTLANHYKLIPGKATTITNAQFKASSKFNSVISLIRHDITVLGVSAIVNAANRSLRGGGGVDGAIHARAGPELLAECKTLGGCEVGSAKITEGYELSADKVIHAVGPIYKNEIRKGEEMPAKLLGACYKEALKLAVENRCKTLAFSCVSTGVFGYPSKLAADVVLDTVRGWLEENKEKEFGGIERIVFCCFEGRDERAYEELVM